MKKNFIKNRKQQIIAVFDKWRNEIDNPIIVNKEITMLKYLFKVIESIFYILYKLFQIIVNILRWYYNIDTKKKKLCLYELYGFDKKYKNFEMDKFLESYKPIIVRMKLNKPLINNFDGARMISLNTFLLLDQYVKENNITYEQLYLLLWETIKELEEIRNSPIVSYYGYTPNYVNAQAFHITNNSLSLDDVDSIYELIQTEKFKNSDSIILILNSVGGYIDSAIKIINILRTNFKTVNIIVPNIAFSAATLISSSADEITVLTKTNFGLVNPYINNIDMILLLESNIFSRLLAYILNESYRKEFGLFPYMNAQRNIKHSSNHLKKNLDKYNVKHKNWFKKKLIIKKLVNDLCSYKEFQSHDMPISPSELIERGMNIIYAKDREKILIEQIDSIHKYLFTRYDDNISKIVATSEQYILNRSHKISK